MTPDELVRAFGTAIDARQASLLVGAGLSRGAGFPLWEDLVDGAAVQVGVPRLDDFPLWAQYVEDAPGGAAILIDEVVRRIASVEPVPMQNHRLMVKLPISDFWTTNYDAMIETVDSALDVVEHDEALVLRRAGDRRLYKMHGSIPYGVTTPVGGRDQLVITRNDYERYAEATHPRLWRLLQAQFLTSSFLFVGFSFDDPNFGEIFKMIRRAITDGPLMPHYALMKRPDDDDGHFAARTRDLEQAGINVVEIPDYNEITSLLGRLVARTLPMRLLVSGSARSPNQPTWTTGTYPTVATPDDLNELATAMGAALAAADVPGLLAAGDVGARVGYSYLQALDAYDPARFVLLRRRDDERDLTPPSRRLGEIRLAETEPSQLRDRAFDSVRCVLLLGGGRGTLDEVRRARAAGMSVVPLAVSGGAAEQVWTEMRSDLPNHAIGQQPVPVDLFDQLAADRTTAIPAAVRLVALGLFLQ
ncbi:SIR2 family protein [Nocardioides carbamazepini]|uniref:SIR2 family protein n=1 Tax=Nocardioides carbamazepini TaxID=2854259 RepID=UPI00214A0872|nr:SIR2 family protein [Nocardioides carbamazepini]MCR1782207.1 SIR2 family protein [Nocardioides carbamazepini]